MPLRLGATVVVTPEDFFPRLKVAISDLTPIWDGPVDKLVIQFFRRQFLSEGQAGGTPWAPLRPATIALKREEGRQNMGVERFSNRLWASLTKRTGPQVVRRITPDEYERGTSVRAAVFAQEGFEATHMFGVPRKHPRRVKPRPLVPEEMPQPFVKAIERYIVSRVENNA